MMNLYRAMLVQDNHTVSFAKLLLRLAFGIGMALHGSGKVEHAFTWMGTDGAVPGFLQAAAAYSEFLGGAAFALGLLTPLATFFMICVMIGALMMVHVPAGHPYVSATGGAASEMAVLYLTVSLLGLAGGPGKLSLDYLLFHAKSARETAVS